MVSVNSLGLKFTSNKISTQLQLSDLPPDCEPWWSPSYPPESDSRYSEPRQYPHPYRHASQSSGYSSADLSGCSRPDDCHSLSQSRDFQGNITNNFFMFSSPVHQNTAPSTPFSGEHDELEELHSVCIYGDWGVDLLLTHSIIWELKSEQLISQIWFHDVIDCSPYSFPLGVCLNKQALAEDQVSMLIICWLISIATT